MKIILFCEDCFNVKNVNVEMKEDGPLYLNKATKSQTKKYKCPACDREVIVVLTIY